jgi:hypothetical protein
LIVLVLAFVLLLRELGKLSVYPLAFWTGWAAFPEINKRTPVN